MYVVRNFRISESRDSHTFNFDSRQKRGETIVLSSFFSTLACLTQFHWFSVQQTPSRHPASFRNSPFLSAQVTDSAAHPSANSSARSWLTTWLRVHRVGVTRCRRRDGRCRDGRCRDGRCRGVGVAVGPAQRLLDGPGHAQGVLAAVLGAPALGAWKHFVNESFSSYKHQRSSAKQFILVEKSFSFLCAVTLHT